MKTNHNHKLLRHCKQLMGCLLLTILFLVAMTVIHPSRAHAAINLNPDPIGQIPGDANNGVYSRLHHCDEVAYNPARWSPGFQQWVSATGQPTQTVITVNYGTPTVWLDLNMATAVCLPTNAEKTNMRTVSPLPSGVSGLPDIGVDWGIRPPVGEYRKSQGTFPFSPPGGFTSSQPYSFKLYFKQITYFSSSGNYECVRSPSEPQIFVSSMTDFGPCLSHFTDFSIQVNVLPIGHVDGISCNYSDAAKPRTGLWGWAADSHNWNISVHVQVFIDGVLWRGNEPADLDRPDVNTNAGIPGRHGFAVNVSVWNDYRPHTFMVKLIGIDANGNPDGQYPILPSSVSLTIGPCAVPSCGTVNTVPANPEPGSSTTITTNFNYSPGSAGAPISNPGTKMRVVINGPSGNPVLDNANVSFNPPPASPANTGSVSFTPTTQGTYSVDFYLTGNVSLTARGCGTFTSANKPYVRFYGNDVSAGGDFGSGVCTDAHGIYGFTQSSPFGFGTQAGSADQFATFALGVIWGFSSASLRSSAPSPTIGLMFANTNPFGSFGGNHCITDYYSNEPTSGVNTIAGTTFTPSGGGQFDYKASDNGGSALTIGGGVPATMTVYVNGDAYINNNIIFPPGPWTSYPVSNVPSFYLIVKGNIYIDPSVTQLDGVYIAEHDSSGSKGAIYTCSDDAAAHDYTTHGGQSDPYYYNVCNKQLTVNGAFIASHVKLLRTYGSLRNSTAAPTVTPPGEVLTSGASKACDNAGGTAPGGNGGTCAAEVFNFSPETYIAQPGIPPVDGGTTQFQFVSSLPPIL